jgi:hypothetical protein
MFIVKVKVRDRIFFLNKAGFCSEEEADEYPTKQDAQRVADRYSKHWTGSFYPVKTINTSKLSGRSR